MAHLLKSLSAFLAMAMVALTSAQNCGIGDGIPTSPPPPFPTEPSYTTPGPNEAVGIMNNCGPGEGRYLGYFSLPETQSPQIPFKTLDTFNVAVAHVRSSLFRIELDPVEEKVNFFVTDGFREHLDNSRNNGFSVIISLRCQDGAAAEDYFTANILDENSRAPSFSPRSLALAVPQSWPIEIPITLQRPIYARDLDFTAANARLAFQVNPPGIVRHEATPLFSGGDAGQMFDYKIDLYLVTGVDAGNYNVQLQASDGKHIIPFYIAVNVTELVCKGQERDPVFGQKGGQHQKVLYYNSTLDFIPSEGDVLPGIVVEAFDPDDVCSIELDIPDSEYLAVSPSSGQVIFTKDLGLADLDTLGRTWIVEVVAKEPTSGKRTTVPLFVSIDFETIHENM